MAVQGPFKVAFGDVFPFGAFVKGGVESVRDFDRSTRENFVQAREKDTGELVWSVEVLDADPESKGTFKVKLTGPVQPIVPEAPAGFPFATYRVLSRSFAMTSFLSWRSAATKIFQRLSSSSVQPL